MRYRIRYAPDELMPRGKFWMMCRTSWGVTLFLRRSMVFLEDDERAHILEEAWAGYRKLAETPPLGELVH